MKRTLFGLLFAGFCIVLTACGTGGSTPPNPPEAQVAIVSPADGARVTALPTTVKVSFTNGADPGSMTALLDGVDISAQFSPPDGNGVRQVQVDRPVLNLGKNQLQIRAGSAVAEASFTVALDGQNTSGSATLPLLIPIKTRYMTGDGSQNSDYNIALFADPNHPDTPTTLIPAHNPTNGQPGNQGFQAVFLRRSDLSMVENILLPNPVPSGDGTWQNSLMNQTLGGPPFGYGPPAGCGTVGCILILQSLGTLGYTPCSSAAFSQDCINAMGVFQGLGASARWLYANGSQTKIAYSYIGNINIANFGGGPTGAYYERLTCSGSNSDSSPCDYLGAPNTSGTAPSDAGPSQIGNMAGALVRDNFLNYTYVQNAPTVAFSSSLDTSNTSHSFTINGNTYWSGFTNSSVGGFHAVVLDATTLALKQNAWWKALPDASELIPIQQFLQSYDTYGNLIFFASFGDTRYTPNTANRATWYQFSRTIAALGGTQQVFYLMNNEEHAPPPQIDDYALVGGFVDQTLYNNLTTGLGNIHAAEMSSVISRETMANPQPSLMEGYLTMNHQGFYSVSTSSQPYGLAKTATADAVNASRMNPIPWPFPGPDPAKSQAAYTWISRQLCCDDIRSAYVNRNVLPLLWLDEISELSYDAGALPNSDESDFNAMKEQLTTEFQYLASVRELQNNIRQIYQDQQSNIGLELQQAQNEVTENVQVDLTTPAQPAKWTGILEDVFGIVGAVGDFASTPEAPELGPAINTAMSLAILATQTAATETNTAGGTSLKAQESIETQVGSMAGQAADEYARTLVQLGNEFDRIVTDWGRLKTVGAPLVANQLPWDSNASGLLLQSYNRLILREFYRELLPAVADVNYYPYTSDQAWAENVSYDGGNYVCYYNQGQYGIDPYWQAGTLPILIYPSGAVNDDHNSNGHGTNYPFDYQWGTWGLVFKEHSSDRCLMSHTQPDTASWGLFAPLDPNNPNTLGAYRYWFFTRDFTKKNTNTWNDVQPCYDAGC